MAKKWDNLHYDFREIDGFNKPFNFIMSPREPGKTTAMWFKKIYKNWKKNKRPWYYLTRNAVEITEALLESISDSILNVFSDDNVKLEYKSGDFKGGIVDVCIKGEKFVRVVALSCKLRKIKLAILNNAAGAFMDEYIIDPKTQEKYLPGEAFKIKEAYTTWRRGYQGKGIFKMYFCANPYSLFNPLFVDWNVPLNNLKRNSFFVGENYVIHWAVLKPALREYLLKVNPLYQFDEEYSNYALEGLAINDAHIKIGQFPNAFKLQFIIRYGKMNIGIYRNYNYTGAEDLFFAKELTKDEGPSKEIYCLNFEEMIERSILLSNEERLRLKVLKNAIRMREISFENINLYYMLTEVYTQL